MVNYTLFSDVSVNPQLKIGIGAYCLLPYSIQILEEKGIENLDDVYSQIKIRVFENTSSTKAEIETILWAISEIENMLDSSFQLTICTDSQGITSLMSRKNKLVNSNFSNSKSETLRNAQLYDKFYRLQEKIKFDIYKIKGHSPKSKKDNLQIIFTVIDRRTRKELRNYIGKLNEQK